MADLLLKQLHAVYLRRESELSDADIRIRGNRISEIAHGLTAEGGERVIDCAGKVALPGLVNSHHHFFQVLTRCLPGAQNSGLFDWLAFHYPIWKHLDEQAFDAANRLAIAELLLTGCTTTSDHLYLFPGEIAQDLMELQVTAAREMGIRFCPTRGSMTLGQSHGGLPPDDVIEDDERVLAHSEECIRRFHDPSPLSMCQVHLAPCSPFNVSKHVMLESARLARRHGVHLHSHLSETRDELEYCKEKYHCTPLELMEEVEWLGRDVWFAHGIHFTESELQKLSKTGTGICHCPSSNMRLGSGAARIPDFRKLGIPLGIGVDGSASNDSSSMLGELRQALLLTRLLHGADAITARDVIAMATEGSASLFGRPLLGQLSAGAAADIALFDLNKIGYAGAGDPIAALLFCGSDTRAWCVIVNGEVVVDGGRLVHGDEDEIARSANKAARQLRESASDT